MPRLHCLCATLLALALEAAFAGGCKVRISGEAPGIAAAAVTVQPDGTATIGRLATEVQVSAETLLEGGGELQATATRRSGDGCTVRRSYASGVTTTETFAGDGSGGVQWSFVASFSAAQRIPVNVTTTVTVPRFQADGWKWWTTWSKSSKDDSAPSPLMPTRALTNASAGGTPLRYNYGGAKFHLDEVTGLPNLPVAPMMNGFALPIFTYLLPKAGAASFLSDPTDQTTYLTFVTEASSAGLAVFSLSRRLLGVSLKTPLKLAGHWVAHEDCWRPALGAFWRYHSEFALPDPRVDMTLTEGAATYAYFFDQTGFQPSDYYAKMDYKVNWDASFPWLYHGPWIPFENDRGYFPVAQTNRDSANTADEFAWVNCDPAGHGGHAINKKTPDWPKCMNQTASLLDGWYSTLQRKLGVSTLVYGTLEEFGMGLHYPVPRKGQDPPECQHAAVNYSAALVCGANRLLQDQFPDAPLIDASTKNPFAAAWGSLVVDFAHPDYMALLLANTERVIATLPSAQGVCLDRGDYIGLLNIASDDGSYTLPMLNSGNRGGVTARALVNSWKAVVPSIAELLHNASKALYMNPDMGHRVDMCLGVDGFYSELGDTPPGNWRTSTAWLASGGKHAAIWCHDDSSILGGSPCARWMEKNGTVRHNFLQSHLMLGVFPSIPFPDNDHELQPNKRADAIYQEYGALFRAIHGKRWFAGAHAVHSVTAGASANVFEMAPFGSGRFTVPLVWAEAGAKTVSLRLRGLARGSDGNGTRSDGSRGCHVTAMLPGMPDPVDVSFTLNLTADEIAVHSVPVFHGSALLEVVCM